VAQVAEKSTGEGLFTSLRESLQPGEAVLLPAAQEGRRELEEALTHAEIEVVRVAAYKSSEVELPREDIDKALEPQPHAVIFGSPRTVDAFLATTGQRGRMLLLSAASIAIGPTTANALRELAAANVVQAETPSSESLVEAAVSGLSGR
ncbi:MAG: uroporphyrinogen-III synthase, partial [Myxococcaceae bacterium]